MIALPLEIVCYFFMYVAFLAWNYLIDDVIQSGGIGWIVLFFKCIIAKFNRFVNSNLFTCPLVHHFSWLAVHKSKTSELPFSRTAQPFQ